MSAGRGIALVTGGAGFIGSHVVDELLANGWDVRVLDLLHPGAHAARPDYLRDEVDHRFADIRNGDAVEAALEGVDAISHQAAMVGLGVDLLDIVEYVSHNSLGTAVLLRGMAMTGFAGRFVLASSMVVYGEGAYRCVEHGLQKAPPRAVDDLATGQFEPRCPICGQSMAPSSVREDAVPDPRNVYAVTKLNQEHLVSALARETGTEPVYLRYHNVYGPRMPRDTPYSGVAAIFRSALAAGVAPRVFEDGGQLRDFVHVRDVARANRLALEAADGTTGAFNVASGEPRTVGALAEALADATGGPPPVVTGEFRRGDVRHVFASIDRAHEKLGFEPSISFADGVAEFAGAGLRDPVRATDA